MVFGWFKKKKPQPAENPYSGLRDLVFSLDPAKIGLTPTPERQDVWGVMMEATSGSAVYTLVALGDGTTSIYYSTGGGILGSGEHAPVAESTFELISLAQNFLNETEATTVFPHPAAGHVRFYLLTFDGVRTSEVDEQDLGYRRHELSPLFHKAHEVIAKIRICTEAQQQNS